MNINQHRFGRRLVYEGLSPDESKFYNLELPSRLIQDREEARAKIGDFETGLQKEYFEEDSPFVNPKLEALNKSIEENARQLALNPSNRGIAHNLYNLKREYDKETGQTGTLGKAFGKYEEAQNQWKGLEANLYKQGASSEEVNKFKSEFFNNRVKSSKEFVPFTPGKVSNRYDLQEDIRDALKDATGKLGTLVGTENAGIKLDTSTGIPMFRVWDYDKGQYISNADAIMAGVNAKLLDWKAPNRGTDRSLYAGIMGYTPEYIDRSAAEIGRSMTLGMYQQLPKENVNYQNVPKYPTATPTNPAVPFWMQSPYNFPEVSTEEDKINKETKEFKEKETLDKLLNNRVTEAQIQKANEEYEKASSASANPLQYVPPGGSVNDPKQARAVVHNNLIKQKEEQDAYINDLKIKYYDFIEEGQTEAQFLDRVQKELAGRQATSNRYFSMNVKGGYMNIDRIAKAAPVAFEDIKTGKTFSFSDIYGKYESAKRVSLFNERSPMFNENLDIVITDVDGKHTYKTTGPLTTIHGEFQRQYQDIKEVGNSTNYKGIAPGILNIPKTIPGDPNTRYIIRVEENPETKQREKVVVMQTKRIETDPITGEKKEVGYPQKYPLEYFQKVVFKNAAQNIIFGEQTIAN